MGKKHKKHKSEKKSADASEGRHRKVDQKLWYSVLFNLSLIPVFHGDDK